MFMSCASKNNSDKFLLLYGSQTGQAKAIAEEIADNAPNFGLLAKLHCLSQTDKKFSIDQELCVVFVVSTTGNGEPPDTAIKFFRRLSKRTLYSDYLQHVNYALLALGDSNYVKFCHFGKQLDARLQALSAKQICNTGYGDDAVGIEIGVDSWLYQLWPTLKHYFGSEIVIALNEISFDQMARISEEILECMRNSQQKMLQVCGNSSSTSTNCSESLVGSITSKELSIYNLTHASDILKEKTFKMPSLPEPYLNISFSPETVIDQTRPLPNVTNLVTAASDIVKIELISAERLTKAVTDVKKTLELTFQFKNTVLEYVPGDSFGFLCCNSYKEVHFVLKRLGLEEIKNVPCQLSILPTSKSRTKLPSHIPAVSTLSLIFMFCVDIRSVPKKALLRLFSKHCKNDNERICLQFLASHEGSEFFTEYLRKPSLSIFDILQVFKSCEPPVERLLEHLPALKPRFYSVACSPLSSPDQFKIIFNVVEIRQGSGRCRDRKGVCTGWFDQLSFSLQHNDKEASIEDKFLDLSLNEKSESLFSDIYVYKRQNRNFILPENDGAPVIMVGPGTGIAPFIGFLKHRYLKSQENHAADFGKTWLFYGCRYEDEDFLYKEELHRLCKSNVLTHLLVCFSRDGKTLSCEDRPRYVQDNIKQHAVEVVKAIEDGASIYVCGDANNMAKDVYQGFISAFQKTKGCPYEEAAAYVKELERNKRYFVDVWT